MIRSMTVVRTGPLALLQDAGRIGHASDGVGRSGAADRASYAQANALVGNPAGATAIECTLGGLVVRAEEDLIVAVTGAPAAADIDGDSVEHAVKLHLPAGQTLRLRGPRSGLRSYLAVAGGFNAPRVLGSASTDTLSKLGPPPLAKGDELLVGQRDESNALRAAAVPATVTGHAVTSLRVLLGPRDDWFDNPADLAVGDWQVSPHSNRVGVRLDRPDADSAPTLHRLHHPRDVQRGNRSRRYPGAAQRAARHLSRRSPADRRLPRHRRCARRRHRSCGSSPTRTAAALHPDALITTSPRTRGQPGVHCLCDEGIVGHVPQSTCHDRPVTGVGKRLSWHMDQEG